jgi:CRISPR-associated protein Cas2
MNQRLWLVCYDVRNEKRLRRTANIMERYGVRVQKSVFECWLTENALDDLRNDIAEVLDPNMDSVRMYTLCEVCQQMCEQHGKTTIQRAQTSYIV